MKTKLIQLTVFLLAFSFNVFSQLPDGSIAPDFTATDINGVKYNLYDILAEGKSVVIDFSATWCGPCWSYKQTGVLEDLYEKAGPDGTNTAMVFMIESDPSTTLDDLKKPGRDWVTGTNHPIIDDASIGNKYHINAYPTVMMICKDGKIKNGIRGYTVEKLIQAISDCPESKNAPNINFFADVQDGCQELEVHFKSNYWPRPDSVIWDFGDGEVSNEKNPVHTYSDQGKYDVSVKATNKYGESVKKKKDFIKIGKGEPTDAKTVGPKDKDIGSGRYFEGGHQGLIFDVFKPVVIMEVTVFSSEERDREIVLEDKDGHLLNTKTVHIPKGEQTISLDFYIDKGNDYRIGLYSDAYLFRNDGGVNYPYTIDGLISITKSTASEPGYYYYYYDWKVREAGCTESNSTDEINKPSLTIYPNPATDIIQVKLNSSHSGTVSYSLFDIRGNLILNIDKDLNEGENYYRIPVENLDTGIYILSAVGNDFYINKKLTISK